MNRGRMNELLLFLVENIDSGTITIYSENTRLDDQAAWISWE